MNDKTAIEKAREALVEIANQEVGTWDNPVPFSVLYRRSVDIAREVLAALDAEKPGEDAREVAQNIIGMALSDYRGLDRLLENDTCIAIEMIQTYAASYHADKCKVCNDFCSRAKEHCEDRESPIV